MENKTPTQLIQELITEVKEKKGLIDMIPTGEAMAIIDVRWLGEEAIKRYIQARQSETEVSKLD